MKLNQPYVFLFSLLVLMSPLSAATISPDSDSSGMFAVIAEREWTTGTDPRLDRQTAVQTSYFEYRESIRPEMPEAPFAPKMPRLEPELAMGLSKEDSLRLMTRR